MLAGLTITLPVFKEYFYFTFLVFLTLKLYVHFFVYKKIKYKDDGRDFVKIIEFLAIHVTFSVLHATLSYYTAYSFIYAIATLKC